MRREAGMLKPTCVHDMHSVQPDPYQCPNCRTMHPPIGGLDALLEKADSQLDSVRPPPC